jgi:hypothetical protein
MQNSVIYLLVMGMATSTQMQIVRIQIVNQNAAIYAMMTYGRLLRKRRLQYWINSWLDRRPNQGNFENLMAEWFSLLSLEFQDLEVFFLCFSAFPNHFDKNC